MTVPPEKRQELRVLIELPGCLGEHLAIGRDPTGDTTVDVSQGGLRLRVSNRPKLKKGDPISVRVFLGEIGRDIRVHGEVRWLKAQREPGGAWDIGVRLSSDQLARWAVWLDTVSPASFDPPAGRSGP